MDFPVKVVSPIMRELRELEKFPELAGDTWPFRGFKDFRGFTADDYAAFSMGTFEYLRNGMSDLRTAPPARCKWKGGSARAVAARARLIELGYTVIEDQDVHHENYKWHSLFFEPKAVAND